jgi:hypothetical protein
LPPFGKIGLPEPLARNLNQPTEVAKVAAQEGRFSGPHAEPDLGTVQLDRLPISSSNGRQVILDRRQSRRAHPSTNQEWSTRPAPGPDRSR